LRDRSRAGKDLQALERLNSAGPNGELAVALSDPDANVRLAAIHASTRINVFRENESMPSVRAAAAAALGEIGDPAARSVVLATSENDTDRFVRDAARVALLRL
jgi:HEAT repeat protein